MPSKRQREQKMKNQYLENGSIYVFKTSGFIKKNVDYLEKLEFT